MNDDYEKHPWQRLEDILDQASPALLEDYFESLSSGEVARTISRLSAADQHRLFRLLSPEDWLNWWNQKLRLENNVSILIRSIHQIPIR